MHRNDQLHMYTISDIVTKYGVTKPAVRNWIIKGWLKATDYPHESPRYFVSHEDLDTFDKRYGDDIRAKGHTKRFTGKPIEEVADIPMTTPEVKEYGTKQLKVIFVDDLNKEFRALWDIHDRMKTLLDSYEEVWDSFLAEKCGGNLKVRSDYLNVMCNSPEYSELEESFAVKKKEICNWLKEEGVDEILIDRFCYGKDK